MFELFISFPFFLPYLELHWRMRFLEAKKMVLRLHNYVFAHVSYDRNA